MTCRRADVPGRVNVLQSKSVAAFLVRTLSCEYYHGCDGV